MFASKTAIKLANLVFNQIYVQHRRMIIQPSVRYLITLSDFSRAVMSSKRQLLLLSSSSPYGYSYLEYAKNDIEDLLKRNSVSKVLFIPYALKDYDKYTSKVNNVFDNWGFKVEGIHTYKSPVSAVKSAEAIFIGGGNTFQLIKGLYDNKLVEIINEKVLSGLPYIGSSAGTNVSTLNICTTNDMPIVHPPSFNALALVPFNINPHYQDPDEADHHQGETREERILQYLEITPGGVVLGLREGATLEVTGKKAILKGVATARLFCEGKDPQEYSIGSDLSFLLE